MDATPIESHADHQAADLRRPVVILVLQKKDLSLALPVVTPVTLGALLLITRLTDLRTLTVRTRHRDRDPRLPPRTILRRGYLTGKLLIWNIPTLHYPFTTAY